MTNDRLAARQQIEKLIQFFDSNIYQFKSPTFNETQARQQLIDPFFESLGWDVHNRLMQPLFRQEVVPESRVKTNVGKEVREQEPLFPKKETLGKEYKEYTSILDYIAEDEYKASSKEAVKKPDYRFRISGQTKFFVEAKKPSVDLGKSQEAIFQVKRYGFSGRVPIAILTDFEEFRTFDCTQRPAFEKPKLGIIKDFDLTYKHYLDQFDRLYDTFSRDAVAGGSLEALTKKMMLKRTGDFALDREFLEDLSKWREELARDIAKHPKNRRFLNDYTLNEAVQRILDRIVFIRVCEDREIEVENTLLAILRMWKERPGSSLYSLLNDLFKQRRALYNGLLFSPHSCEELEIGNEVLIKILENLNYPFSPYHFNEIGVEILGSIYEKFLGKTIHLAPKNVVIKEKPEVRKAGGVYYTPQYIVKYIVDNTLGKLLYEEMTPSVPTTNVGTTPPTIGGEISPPSQGGVSRRESSGQGGGNLKLPPKQVAKLKIIDIACGSGSFLLGAFQKLIDYHIEWYTIHPEDIKTENNVPDAYKDVDGNYHLSPRKKRNILVNNIYGVDIDRQAVEVTQMSLYLKVLEGENAETLNPQMTLALKEVYLPSLANNIKCGNSLISTDFTSQGEMFDDEARRKVNPFDWEMEFPEILGSKMNPPPTAPPFNEGGNKGGFGFDVVIGNPPYVRMETQNEIEKEIFKKTFQVFHNTSDLFVYFIERGVNLLHKNGRFGFIVSNKWMRSNYGEPLRHWIKGKGIEEIIDFQHYQIFEGATTYPCIISLQKDNSTKTFKAIQVNNLDFVDLKKYCSEVAFTVNIDKLDDKGWILANNEKVAILDKLQFNTKPVTEYTGKNIYRGIITGFNEAFIIDEKKAKKLINKNKSNSELLKPYLEGKDIKSYSFLASDKFLIFIPNSWTRSKSGKSKDPWKWFKTNYPEIADHLSEFEKEAIKRYDQGEYWWELRSCAYYSEFEKPKICWGNLSNKAPFALDKQNYYINAPSCILPTDNLYVLGCMNSKLLWWFLKDIAAGRAGGYIEAKPIYVQKLPIRTIDFNNPDEKKMHDNLVSLVEKMLELNKQLQKAHFDSEKEPIERQIAATDKKIDELVYKLYGLTEEEIAIVEGKNAKVFVSLPRKRET